MVRIVQFIFPIILLQQLLAISHYQLLGCNLQVWGLVHVSKHVELQHVSNGKLLHQDLLARLLQIVYLVIISCLENRLCVLVEHGDLNFTLVHELQDQIHGVEIKIFRFNFLRGALRHVIEKHCPEHWGPRGKNYFVALDILVLATNVKITELLVFKSFEQINSNLGCFGQNLFLNNLVTDVLYFSFESDDSFDIELIIVKDVFTYDLIMRIHLRKPIARIRVNLVETEVMFVGILDSQDKFTHHLQLDGVIIPEEQGDIPTLLLIPAIGVQIDAQLEPVDHELAGLKLLAKLEVLHLCFEIFNGPSVGENHVWFLCREAPPYVPDLVRAGIGHAGLLGIYI